LKIGTIDVSKILTDYVKSADANRALEESLKSHQNYLAVLNRIVNNLVDQVRDLEEELQKPDLDEKKREQLEIDLGQKRTDLQVQRNQSNVYARQASTRINNLRAQKRGDLLREIRAEVDAHAKEQKFHLVLETSGNNGANVPAAIYTDGKNDITAEITKRLNARAEADAPPPPEEKKKP